MGIAEREQILLEKYLRDQCSLEEQEELYRYLISKEDSSGFESVLENLWKEIAAERSIPPERAEAMLKKVLEAGRKPAPRVLNFVLLKVAAAALILMGVGAVLRHQLNRQSPGITQPANRVAYKKTPPALQKPAPIVPGSSKAILVLGNGAEIALSDSAGPQIIEKDGARVSKLARQLVYQSGASGQEGEEVQYNTLITPRGGEYAVVLPDGTKVWLNADSRLYYPTRFTGSERKVELKGEAYFEVVHNAAQPFEVVVNGLKVTDIGTRFDIRAYGDEPAIKTTLVEGKVKVENMNAAAGAPVLLHPGSQAVTPASGGEIRIVKTDIDDVLGWKNGLFIFDGESLGGIMSDISRWYDVNVQFDNPAEQRLHFTGSIRKYGEIQTVLHLLALTGEVRFTIEGHKVSVIRNKSI